MKLFRWFILILFTSPTYAYSYNTTFNPFTNRHDYVNVVTSITLPSGSTQYIQNTSTQQVNAGFWVEKGTFTKLVGGCIQWADGVQCSSPTADHGLLAGLADDDHPQYIIDTGDTMNGNLTFSSGNKVIVDTITVNAGFPKLFISTTTRIDGQVQSYRGYITSGPGLNNFVCSGYGLAATDTQIRRDATDRCASGNFSSLTGGLGNRSSGEYSHVGGGDYNIAYGLSNVIAGGSSGVAFANYSSVLGGLGNDAHDNYSSVLGGYYNINQSAYGTILGGREMKLNGERSVGFSTGSITVNQNDSAVFWGVDMGLQTVTPQAKLDINGYTIMRTSATIYNTMTAVVSSTHAFVVKANDGSSLFEIGPDGYIHLSSAATTWDDTRVSGLAAATGVSAPDLITFGPSGNLKVRGFDGVATSEQLYFTVEMPHTWKQGTAIIPHIHWAPVDSSSGNVKWSLEYATAAISGIFPSPTTISVTVPSESTAWKQYLVDFTSIDMTGAGMSAMLIGRIFRDPGDGADTYGADAALINIDFHYQIDSLGARTEN